MIHPSPNIRSARQRRRGVVLLMVLAVLGLLSVLAVSFVSLSKLERSISRNYVDRTRAQLAAESGVDYALSRIRALRGGVLQPEEATDMQYENGGNVPSLESSQHPSYCRADGPYSGTVGGTYIENGDQFKLRVSDESSKINLNDSNERLNMPDSDPLSGTRRLVRLVSYVCELLFSADLGPGIGSDIAIALQERRDSIPGGKFSSMEEVRDLLVGGGYLREKDYPEFSRHFTVYSWTDTRVLRPTFTADITAPAGMESPKNALGGGDIYMFMDMQTTRYALDARSPVNINTAPIAALQAIFSMVSGWYLKEEKGEYVLTKWHYGGYLTVSPTGAKLTYSYRDETAVISNGVNLVTVAKDMRHGELTRTAEIGSPASPMEDSRAAILANHFYSRIHGSPVDVIETWDEFESVLRDTSLAEAFAAEGMQPLSAFEIDALLANCNPNSQLNDFNPDASSFRRIDKSKLVTNTTEFCFEPTGAFGIDSYGLILNGQGRKAASATVSTVMDVFRYLRLSTQADFMGSCDTVEELRECVSESDSGLTAMRTDSYNGVSVQSYPEPFSLENFYRESVFDGSLKLATWQPDIDELTFGAQPGVSLIAGFDGVREPEVWGLNPDTETDIETPGYGSAGPYYDSTRWEGYLYNNPQCQRLTYDMNAPADSVPGSIFPDGALSDPCRTLGFQNGNVGSGGGTTGAVHFWIKPNFRPEYSQRIRSLLTFCFQTNLTVRPTGMRLLYFCASDKGSESVIGRETNVSNWIPTRSMLFGWGFPGNNTYLTTGTVNHRFATHASATHAPGDSYNFDAHTWNHIGLTWKIAEFKIGMAVNGCLIPDSRIAVNDTASAPPASIWENGVSNVMGLGSTVFGCARSNFGTTTKLMNFTADCTYDDVVGYLGWIDPANLSNQWTYGRYYNGENAVYTCPGMDLHREFGLDRRVEITPRSVSWTVYWPELNRDRDAVADNLLPRNADGDVLDASDSNDDIPDDPLAGRWGAPLDPVSVDVGVERNGTVVWMYDAPETMRTYAGGSSLSLVLSDGSPAQIGSGDRFRFRVRFNLEADQSVYDSPIFDDISFTFFVKPRVLFWRCNVS